MFTMFDPKSVLIAEDNELLRLGIRATLLNSMNLQNIIEAVDGAEAVEKHLSMKPDVVVMDISMPKIDGIEATRIIKGSSANTKIIMLTASEGRDAIYRAFSAGASGYCKKDSSIGHLVEGIRTVSSGELWLDTGTATTIFNICTELDRSIANKESMNRLTLLEMEFITQISSGKTIADVCEHLALEPGVSKTCLVNILKKVASYENIEVFLESKSEEPVLQEESSFSSKYEILSKLGEGGMSSVFKARHKALGKLVAVKVLNGESWRNRTIQTRFQREAQITSRLSHPYIIGVHDFGVSLEQPYIVMDYVDGPSLAQIVERCGPLREAAAVKIFLQLAEALEYAHSRRVVHRDLKPSNVMISCQGERTVSHLVDFGIARQVQLDEVQEEGTLTMNGEVMGSPLYMSPEQCLGRKVDNRSDIYSLGCLMYESLHGWAPFIADTALETMNMHLRCQPSFESTIISPAIRELIFRCMQKTASNRFGSMQDVRNALLKIK